MEADPWREVWRDAFLLIVDKPAGLPSQGTRAGEPGLFDLLREREAYVGLHHRLDRNASGLLVFTLDPSANAGIAEGLRTGRIRRTYRAALEGDAEPGSWTWPVDGRPARTDVVVHGRRDGLTEVTCTLHTGRRHQIRVHAAMAGTPVLGDRRYGGDVCRPWPRLGLHAARLELPHPITGDALACVSEAPSGWARQDEPTSG